MLKLFLVDSEQNRTVVPLLRSEITIGRAEGNTIRLTDQNISRVHARLVRTETGYAIEDLSRYGVLGPNGPIAGSTAIGSGESYRIGDYLLEFKEERASLPLPAARPKSPLPQPKSASTAASWGVTSPPAAAASTSIQAAPPSSGEALITPAGTGTAVFLSDDIDAALSGFGGSATTEPAAVRPAPASSSSDSGGSTAGSLAVEPEPVFSASREAAAQVAPPTAPPATAPAAPALEAPADFFGVAKEEAPKPTMTLRPTSVQAMKLVGQTAPFTGAELHLTTPRIVLGSGSACDVVLEHAGIAPEHLALRYDGSSWWVDALSGQVRLDGDLVPTSKLWKGAVITLGGLDFRFAEPAERQSVRLAPVVAVPTARVEAASDGVNEFDAEILKRGKRNQTIGIGVGVAAALGLMALLAVGGEDEAPAAGSAESEVAATAPADPAPKVEPVAGSGSGAAAGSGSGVAVAAVVDDAAAKAAAEAKAAEDAKAAAEAEKAAKVAAAAQAAADAKASAEAEKAAKAAAAVQAAADRKAAAEAAKAEKAAKAAQAAAERRAAAEAATAAREAKAAEAARARAARAAAPPEPRAVATPRTAPARAAAPAPTPARAAAAAPAKATPPTPFQEVAPAAAAEPAGPTAQSLIADAKRAAVQNNRRDAVKFLEQARRLDPKNAEVNQLLFSNYRALGNTLRASEAVKRYLALKPNDPKRSDYENWLEQNATP